MDDNCRDQFHNAAEFHALYPIATAMKPFAPRVEEGFALQRIQGRIAARAGLFSSPGCAGPLRGYVDSVQATHITGWAQDIDNLEEPVTLEILIEGHPFACILANGYRTDFRQAAFGSGCHGFWMTLCEPLSGPVSVRRVSDGALLPLTYEAHAYHRKVA